MSGDGDVVGALGQRQGVEQLSDGSPEAFNASFGGFSEQGS